MRVINSHLVRAGTNVEIFTQRNHANGKLSSECFLDDFYEPIRTKVIYVVGANIVADPPDN